VILSILALSMLAIGFISVILVYEVLGHPQGPENKKRVLLIHRIFGYLFIAIFIFEFIIMLLRLKAPNELSPQSAIHAAVALLVAGLLIIKLSVVRRYKKFVPNLFWIGSIIFVLAIVFVVLTAAPRISAAFAGPELIKSERGMGTKPVAPSMDNLPPKLLLVEGKFIRLCGQCHPISKALHLLPEKKSKDEWVKIVVAMKAKTGMISDQDSQEISDFLAQFSAK